MASKTKWMLATLFVFSCLRTVVAETAQEPVQRRWSLNEVEVLLAEFAVGRSFSEGRRLFRLKNCVKCHRTDGEGNEFGPDLAKMNRDVTLQEVAKQVVQPSANINKDHQVMVFQLKSGRTVQGLVVATGRDYFRVVENPLESSQAKKVRLQDVENRFKSTKSQMPEGLLDGLQATEVLDLLAFVYAGGNDGHDVYHAAGSVSQSTSTP